MDMDPFARVMTLEAFSEAKTTLASNKGVLVITDDPGRPEQLPQPLGMYLGFQGQRPDRMQRALFHRLPENQVARPDRQVIANMLADHGPSRT